jgi:predicted enzyme related to lactoylglutathione lyase
MVNAATFNAPNWVDLSTPDADASIDFYRELLGWEFKTQETEMGVYHVASVDRREVCGVMEQAPEMAGAPASWTVFFNVEDIDAAVEAVGEAGGRILEPPFEIPGGARVSVVADSVGAMFALICGGPGSAGVWLSMRPGSVCWVETMSRDVEASRMFYEAIFGWECSTSEDGYSTFTLNGESVAGLLAMPPMMPVEAPSHWAVYFAVADCDVTERSAVDLGGSVLVETTPVEIGRFAVLEDPAGAAFDIMDISDANADHLLTV